MYIFIMCKRTGSVSLFQIFHEVTVANLLETILFHREAAENADDRILDLVDYCYRKLSQLVAL